MSRAAPSRDDSARIALVGAGLIGRIHLKSLRACHIARPVALVDPDPEARRLAAEYNVTHYKSLELMLDSMRPDGAIIATPNALHVAQAMSCLQRRVPILLEKPVAPTLSQAEPLRRLADDNGTPVLVGHHRAHSPIMQQAVRLIQEGGLGRVVAITGSAAFYKPDDYFNAAPWRRAEGGGPVLINLIHDIHAYRSLCGEIDAVQAMSSCAVRAHDVEDSVTINLRFANGALGNFLLSDTAATTHSWEQTSGENPAYANDPGADCYLVSGTRGSLSIPSLTWRHCATDEQPSWWRALSSHRLPIDRLDPIERQLTHFVAVIRGECEPLVTLNDGLANLSVIEAVLAAAATNGTVTPTSLDATTSCTLLNAPTSPT